MMSYLIWHTHSDLNREQQFWRLSCYHYTIGINKKGGSLPVAVRIAHFVEDFKPSEPSLFFRFFVRWPQLIVPPAHGYGTAYRNKLKKAPNWMPSKQVHVEFPTANVLQSFRCCYLVENSIPSRNVPDTKHEHADALYVKMEATFLATSILHAYYSTLLSRLKVYFLLFLVRYIY